jgi:predicted metal-binding protein
VPAVTESPRNLEGVPLLVGPPEPVEILVCTTCRHGMPRDGAGERDGARLLARLSAGSLPEGVTLRGVECLSNCERGCTVALRGRGRWTYVYGALAPSDAAVILEGAARYRDAADGLVPWRERPPHFRKNCIARVPPMEGGNDG